VQAGINTMSVIEPVIKSTRWLQFGPMGSDNSGPGIISFKACKIADGYFEKIPEHKLVLLFAL